MSPRQTVSPRNQTLAPTATAASASAPSRPAITASANCIPDIDRLLMINGPASRSSARISSTRFFDDVNTPAFLPVFRPDSHSAERTDRHVFGVKFRQPWPDFCQLLCEIGQGVLRLGDFPREWNNGVYFRVRKILQAIKD